MNIASRLDIAMRAKGFREVDLARTAGVSQSTTNRLLSGKGKFPDAVLVYKLACACGVSVEWLISGQNSAHDHSVSLAYITGKEANLLTLYRKCDAQSQGIIMIAAEEAANLA